MTTHRFKRLKLKKRTLVEKEQVEIFTFPVKKQQKPPWPELFENHSYSRESKIKKLIQKLHLLWLPNKINDIGSKHPSPIK